MQDFVHQPDRCLPGHVGSDELYSADAVQVLSQQLLERCHSTGTQLNEGIRYYRGLNNYLSWGFLILSIV